MIVATCPGCNGLVSTVWFSPDRFRCELCKGRIFKIQTADGVYWLTEAEMRQIEERMRIRQRILA